MKIPSWINRKIKDLSLEDAMQANEDGVMFVCGDGKLRQIMTSPERYLLNILRGKGV